MLNYSILYSSRPIFASIDGNLGRTLTKQEKTFLNSYYRNKVTNQEITCTVSTCQPIIQTVQSQ